MGRLHLDMCATKLIAYAHSRTPTLLLHGCKVHTPPALLSAVGVSNLVQTLCNRKGVDPALPTFLATASVNIPSSVLQIRCFASWFGTAQTAGFSLLTYGLMASRDMATVLSSFTLPSLLTTPIERVTGTTPENARFGAQLLVPSAVAILIHPPLHLLALDLYNRPTLKLADRFPLLSSLVPSTALVRFARIMPAFGCGGIINRYVREQANSQSFKMPIFSSSS